MLRTNIYFYLLLFTISIILYFAHATYTLHGIYGDGNGYYSYTHALYFRQSLDFSEIYNHLENFNGRKYIFSRVFWDQSSNPYLIGTGILWLPSVVFIEIINFILNLGQNRFSLIYELGPGISGVVFMISGLKFLEIYLNNFFGKRVVFKTLLTLFFATNIFYYTALEPALSHQPSFLIICFLLWRTYKFKKSVSNLIILGILAGILASVRLADTILLIPIFLQSKINIKNSAIVILSALIGFLPQLINQQYMYGTILTHPYLTGGSGTWDFSLYKLFEYLFSPLRGLFLWTPVFLIAYFGLIIKRKFIFIFTILLLWLITSSWSAYLSAGFGQRFSFAAIPLFAFGLSAVYQKLKSKWFLVIFLISVGWNFMLLKNVYLHRDFFIQKPDFNYTEFFNYMLKLN